MRYVPAMEAETVGFRPIGSLRTRSFAEAAVDVWDVECSAAAHGRYLSPDPRLFVTLGQGECVFEMEKGSVSARHEGVCFSFIPARTFLTGRVAGAGRLSHLDVHFSERFVLQQLDPALRTARLGVPRLAVRDDLAAVLVDTLLADAHDGKTPADIYGEVLVRALLWRILGGFKQGTSAVSRLSAPALARVIVHMDRECFSPFRLVHLARLAEMSESRFGQAFRATTGITPMRWHMSRRVARLQHMLLEGDRSLTELAHLAGFADHAHLTRSFKALVGLPPTQWLRRALATV
ncbi:helix-turn-helix domain-containing protein [Consotaella salsifontis]|uniref:Transcriptional regulator, AraC family n=1 Tax=Consotaella salsifontis TaxID=1365950 RepID=A0A1T4TET9_9HYPH|nr:AraC family transcriptional regulator [Consotaella salsifontis]SKA38709.1 transcriptional regulator, AraC family [Consotaella salsifontis]